MEQNKREACQHGLEKRKGEEKKKKSLMTSLDSGVGGVTAFGGNVLSLLEQRLSALFGRKRSNRLKSVLAWEWRIEG